MRVEKCTEQGPIRFLVSLEENYSVGYRFLFSQAPVIEEELRSKQKEKFFLLYKKDMNVKFYVK